MFLHLYRVRTHNKKEHPTTEHPVYMVLVLDHIWQVENPNCWHTKCYNLFMHQLWLSAGQYSLS